MTQAPRLSVLLPVYNAMPYLPIAVRDMLKQRLADDAPLELLVAFDGGDDGSLESLSLTFMRVQFVACSLGFAIGRRAWTQRRWYTRRELCAELVRAASR